MKFSEKSARLGKEFNFSTPEVFENEKKFKQCLFTFISMLMLQLLYSEESLNEIQELEQIL